MRCPDCLFIQSDPLDLCQRCLIDLRPSKRQLGLTITEANLPYESLLKLQKRQASTTTSLTRRISNSFARRRSATKKRREPSISRLKPGTFVDKRFRIEEEIGFGATGDVYLALDTFLESQKVALKILRPHIQEDAENRERFFQEIRTTRQVTDTNVVRAFEAGIWNHQLYFTMEHVHGIPLDQLLVEKDLSFPHALKIISQVCKGMHAIHAAGILHRDIKAENILLTLTNDVKIADFGIAHPVEASLLNEEHLVGSIPYMAPEIWLGEPLSPQTDIYALGILCYELLSGRRPFRATTTKEMIVQHLAKHPAPLCEQDPRIPTWISNLVGSMLEKSPNQRPSSVNQIKIEIVQHYMRNTQIPSIQYQGTTQSIGI